MSERANERSGARKHSEQYRASEWVSSASEQANRGANGPVLNAAKEMNRLHVALNDAIRKIFTFSRWESVKCLRESFGYLSITEIFSKRKRSFFHKIPRMGNLLLSTLINLE